MSGLTPSRGNFEQNRQLGFSLIQMIIAIAIISIVTTFGILGITKARGHMRVQNSARRFAVLIEKARADSVRRHLAAGSQSWVKTFAPGTNTFQVSMDFDGNGTVQTRTFTLDPDCTFSTISQTASFDWRGRIPARLAFQITNGSISIPVDVSGSGDITVDAQAFEDDLIPDNTPTPVSGDVTADPTPLPTATPTPSQSPSGTPTPTPTATPTPNGNGNGSGNGNGNGNGSPTPTPTPTPTATPTPSVTPTPTPTPDLGSQCTASVSPSSLILSQTVTTNKTGTVTFTLQNATGSHSVNTAIAGNGSSLTLSASPTSISGSGSSVITVGAKEGNGNRGSFLVEISASPTCGAAQTVTVTVNN